MKYRKHEWTVVRWWACRRLQTRMYWITEPRSLQPKTVKQCSMQKRWFFRPGRQAGPSAGNRGTRGSPLAEGTPRTLLWWSGCGAVWPSLCRAPVSEISGRAGLTINFAKLLWSLPPVVLLSCLLAFKSESWEENYVQASASIHQPVHSPLIAGVCCPYYMVPGSDTGWITKSFRVFPRGFVKYFQSSPLHVM